MQLRVLPKEFEKAKPLLTQLNQAGFEAYFVGGSVRDAVLGRDIHDVDIATSAYPEEIKRVFKRTVDLGVEHGTILVLEGSGRYEITTFRLDGAYTDYRRPDSVTFVRQLTEDLKRRDFTINALAMDEKGQIIDCFGGLDDLKKGEIKAVGLASERFSEDALRIMRAMRFVASLGFQIEENTAKAMRENAPLLKEIAVERLFIELDKMLLAKGWKEGLNALYQAGAAKFLPNFGELDAAKLSEQFVFKNSVQAWSWVILELSKKASPFLRDWKVAKQFTQQVSDLTEAYLLNQWSLASLYRYGLEIAKWADDLKQAEGLEVDQGIAVKFDQQLQIHHKSELALSGKELMALGMQAGPSLGRVLSELLELVIDNQLENEPKMLTEYAKQAMEKEGITHDLC